MSYLTQSNWVYDVMIEQLETLVKKEMIQALHSILPKFRDREVSFDDTMGSATVNINLRSGRVLLINANDYWISGSGPQPRMSHLKWLKQLQELVSEYDKIQRGRILVVSKITKDEL